MLENSIVVVTGAGSGLGRALCLRFARSGAFVFGLGRTVASLEETGKLIEGDRYSWFEVDVQHYEQVAKAVDAIIARHDRIDYLFNAAAVYPKRSFLEESADQWAEAIAINVNGPANCCKAVLPHMIRNDFGRIFNVGSFADIAPIRDSAAYSCSKGALHALSKAIHSDIETLEKNVEVHEWTPGHLNTQMSDFTGIDPAISAEWAYGITQLQHDAHHARVFENDSEQVAVQGLRGRIKNKIRSLLPF